MLATRILFIVISSSVATGSEDSSKDVCRPCTEVKCPPLPADCVLGQKMIDKCGCCMTCVLEHHAEPSQNQSSVEDTKLKSLKTATDDDNLHKFMYKSSRDGFPPLMRETIRIRIFPLGGDGEITPENQMRSILSNVPNVPSLRNILEMLGSRNSPTAEIRGGLHDSEATTSNPDKIVDSHEKVEFKSLSGEEVNKMNNSQETNGSKSKSDSFEGQDKSFKITRISIVPIVYKFSRPNITDSQEKSLPGNLIKYNSTSNTSEDSGIPNTVVIRRIHFGDPFEGNMMPFGMDPRFHIINSVMRLMMSHLMDSQARQLSHDFGFNKDREYSESKETMNDDVTSRITARHNNKLLASHPSLKVSLGSKSAAEQYANAKLQMPKHDLPGIGMKQLEENLIDSMEGKSNSGDMSLTIVKTSSRNKRDTQHESEEQNFRLFDLPFPLNDDVINPMRLLGNILNEQVVDPINNWHSDMSSKRLNLANTNKISDQANSLDFNPNIANFENPFESMPLNLLDKMFNRIKSAQSGGKNTFPAYNFLNMFLKDLRRNRGILNNLPKALNAHESIMSTINMKSDRDVDSIEGTEEFGNRDVGQPFLLDLFENRNLKNGNAKASKPANSDGLPDTLSLKKIKSAFGKGQNPKDFQIIGTLKNLDLKRMLDKSYFLKRKIPKDVLRRVMDKILTAV